MRRAFVVAVFALIVCVTQAYAVEGEFSLSAGFTDPARLNMEQPGTPFQFNGSGIYSARAEIIMMKYFGFEQNIGFTPRLLNDTKITFLYNNQLVTGQASWVHGLFYSSNFVVNIPIRVEKFSNVVPYITPFFTLGIGALVPWGEDFDTFNNTVAGNYGVGVKLDRIKGPIGFRLDVRNWRSGGIKQYGTSYGGVTITEYSAGITYMMGE